jgi:hypothetical protein
MPNAKCISPDVEPAKRFRFAVTWSSLTAHLEPCEVDHAAPAAAPANSLVAAGLAALALPHQEEAESSAARWEMVVPKMVRNGSDPGAAERPQPRPAAEGQWNGYTPPEPARPSPATPSQTLLSRLLSALRERTRPKLSATATPSPKPAGPFFDLRQSAKAYHPGLRRSSFQLLQLNAPEPDPTTEEPAAPETPNQPGNREMLLSRIMGALRTRSANPPEPGKPS